MISFSLNFILITDKSKLTDIKNDDRSEHGAYADDHHGVLDDGLSDGCQPVVCVHLQ